MRKNKVIIQEIIGGLGNQMSQYAFIKALSIRNKVDFKLNISGFINYNLHKYSLEFFNIHKNYAKLNEIPFYKRLSSKNKYINIAFIIIKGFLKRLDSNYFLEKQLTFNPDFLNINSGYIEGYFQTEKYFKNYEDEIRKDFKFKIAPSKKNKEYIKIIESCNSISLHVRRGDYLTKNGKTNLHGTCDLQYYKKAINIINKKITNPVFFLFSNDINWVKKNLKIENKSYYIDFNNADTNYEDMRLMSLCKHNIIANSSFSWWGAWLNNNKTKIVIAPKKRLNNTSMNYSDVVPNNYIKI